MTTLVVDASIAAKWWFPENHRAEAMLLHDRDVRLRAPAFIRAELSNVVLQKFRRSEVGHQQADAVIAALSRMPVALTGDGPLLLDAHRLARAYHPSAYDCLYAALAVRENCPVVTADRRFYQALAPAIPGHMLWIEDIAAYLEQHSA